METEKLRNTIKITNPIKMKSNQIDEWRNFALNWTFPSSLAVTTVIDENSVILRAAEHFHRAKTRETGGKKAKTIGIGVKCTSPYFPCYI